MTYVRPSQPRAMSKARPFKKLAAGVLTALTLGVGPGRLELIDAPAAGAASDATWAAATVLDSPVAGEDEGERSDNADAPSGPELLRHAAAVVRRGRGEAVLAAASWSAPGPRLVRMRVTAYCPCEICCGPRAAGITASGRTVAADNGRFVAADPVLAFGTRLVVPGYNAGRPVRVLDRGGAIRGRSLDVYFDSHERARRWGVRYLAVAIMPG